MGLFSTVHHRAQNRRRQPYDSNYMEMMRLRNPVMHNLFVLRRRNPQAAQVLADYMNQQRANRIRNYTRNYNRWRNSFNIRPASRNNRDPRQRGPNIPYGPGFHEGAYNYRDEL